MKELIRGTKRFPKSKNDEKYEEANDLFCSNVESNKWVRCFLLCVCVCFSMWRNIVATCGRLRSNTSASDDARTCSLDVFAAYKNIEWGKPHSTTNIQ